MSLLYAASREALAEALGKGNGPRRQAAPREWVDYLIESGWVTILDPDDDALVERLSKVSRFVSREDVRDVLRALAP